jgi:hypothetical protein
VRWLELVSSADITACMAVFYHSFQQMYDGALSIDE